MLLFTNEFMIDNAEEGINDTLLIISIFLCRFRQYAVLKIIVFAIKTYICQETGNTSVSMDVIAWLCCSLILDARRSDARIPLFLEEYLRRSLEGATKCFL